MKTIEDELSEHPFFSGLDDAYLKLLSGCGQNVHFQAGEHLFKEGDDANAAYIIRKGLVGLEIHSAGQGSLTLQTEGLGEVVGASWLFEPYKCLMDARAVEAVSAIALDGRCLRGKCEQDPALGYELMRRFARIFVERLQHARLRLLDLYGQEISHDST